MNFRCKFRHRLRFADPDFLLECKISAIWRRFLLFLHYICWMSAIFLLPVCLTYWPRKYTTRVDPHVDYFRQVWSWYDHTLPSYSVFVCRHVTWPCDFDLWSFDLEHMSRMARQVTNTATNYENTKPIRSSAWSTSWLWPIACSNNIQGGCIPGPLLMPTPGIR